MDNSVHVTCGLDSKYTRFAGVLLVSLFENNKNEHIVGHIMGLGLTETDKSDLKEIAMRYNNELRFYDMNESMFCKFPSTNQWNITVYFRLVIPDMIDESIERLLYFDCDIICRGAIRELYEMDLQGNIIGAVEDHVLSPRLSLCYINKICPDNFYFNSGMLLIDCKAWRSCGITQRCIDYLNKEHPMHFDQDTLNAVLQNSWKHLSYRWNFMADFHGAYFTQEEFDMDIKKSYHYYPVIIHFTGLKPWNHANKSVYKADFFMYQSLTKWKDFIPQHTIADKVKHVIMEICIKLGIKKRHFNLYEF